MSVTDKMFAYRVELFSYNYCSDTYQIVTKKKAFKDIVESEFLGQKITSMFKPFKLDNFQ